MEIENLIYYLFLLPIAIPTIILITIVVSFIVLIASGFICDDDTP